MSVKRTCKALSFILEMRIHMYAYFRGIVTEIEEDMIVLECNHIGYNIKVPTSVIGDLAGTGAEVKIYTYTSVREDAFVLYGFLTKDDLKMFKQLITVNGIGPKGALGILSVLSASDLRFAILAGDAKAIAKAPGVGAKSAERIILELKNKVELTLEEPSTVQAEKITGIVQSGEKNEAIEAMVALGYSATEAMKAVSQIAITEDMDSGSILKQALKNIVRL